MHPKLPEAPRFWRFTGFKKTLGSHCLSTLKKLQRIHVTHNMKCIQTFIWTYWLLLFCILTFTGYDYYICFYCLIPHFASLLTQPACALLCMLRVTGFLWTVFVSCYCRCSLWSCCLCFCLLPCWCCQWMVFSSSIVFSVSMLFLLLPYSC